MLVNVQLFFLILNKKKQFSFILLFLFVVYCQIQKKYHNNFFKNFIIKESCVTNGIIPNLTFFSKSLLRSNQFEPNCKFLKSIESSFPIIIDGVSIYSSIWMPISCKLEKNYIPSRFKSNLEFFLLNLTYSKFENFFLIYKEDRECGLEIIPLDGFKENSIYALYLGKNQFFQFLKSNYKNEIDKEWNKYKELLSLKIEDQELKKSLESFKKTIKENFNFNLDSGIYSVFPIRSFSALFPSFLYYLEMRNKNLEIQILSKKEIHKNFNDEFSGKVFLLQYKEKEKSKDLNFITIPYLDFYDKKINIKQDYINQLYLFFPSFVSNQSYNIIITNTNIIDHSLFRKLAYDTNSIIVVYFIFKNPYYNFLSDIFLNQNVLNILKAFNILFINKIYKICFYDVECITSTFFEPKIDQLLLFKIPEEYQNILKNQKYDYSFRKFSNIKKKHTLSKEKRLEEYSLDFIKEIIEPYAYFYNQNKLKNLNYDFRFRNIDQIYETEFYSKLIEELKNN